MPTLPNMSLITPTPGSDSGTWDDKINACFGLIDEHDHTDGKGVRITSAALNIDDDVSFDTHTLLDAGRVHFAGISTPDEGSYYLFVNIADGELYWRTSGGSNVRLTNGTALDISLVGGIVGDYSSVGAEVAFDDADDRYTFVDGDGKWTRLATGPVRIYEFNTTESVYVEHAVAAGLAAPYTVTWPAALPTTYTAQMKISTAGAVSFSETTTIQIPPSAAWTPGVPTSQNSMGSAGGAIAGLGKQWIIFSTDPVIYPIVIPEGSTITGISLKITKASTAATDIVMELVESDGWGNWAAVAAFTVTNSANNPGNVTSSGSGTQVATAGKQYAIRGYQTGTTFFTGGDRLGVATVTYA